MTQVRTRPRRSPSRRPDRAVFHAELVDLGRLEYAGPLSGWLSRAAMARLRDALEDAKEKTRTGTSIRAALRVLAALGALHAVCGGGRGYRGVVAPSAVLAEAVARATCEPCGERTLRNALRILQAAGLLWFDVAGRGRLVDLGDGRKVQRQVLTVTVEPKAVALWSRSKASPIASKNETENIADNGVDEGARRATGDARSSSSGHGRSPPDRPRGGAPPSGVRESTRPRRQGAATIGHGVSDAGKSPEGASPFAVRPKRVYAGRPMPHEPNTAARGRRALLYDIETEAIRRVPRLRVELVQLARQELELDLPGIGLDSLVFRWRGMPRPERQRLITDWILPGLRQERRRADLERRPADPRARRQVGPSGDPGPRLRPQAEATKPNAGREDRPFDHWLVRWRKEGIIP